MDLPIKGDRIGRGAAALSELLIVVSVRHRLFLLFLVKNKWNVIVFWCHQLVSLWFLQGHDICSKLCFVVRVACPLGTAINIESEAFVGHESCFMLRLRCSLLPFEPCCRPPIAFSLRGKRRSVGTP